MYKNLFIAALAATALSASAIASSAADGGQFIFRWKAGLVTPAGGGSGGTGAPGDGSEAGGTGGSGLPGDGSGSGDDDSGGTGGSGGDGDGDGGGDGDGDGTPSAKKYNLVWVSQGRSPDDTPGADGTPPFADGARQYAPDFLNLPSGTIMIGDTLKICWESPDIWNRPSARSTIEFYSADNVVGGIPATISEPSEYGCFDLKTGGEGQDYGYLSFGISVTSDWYGYPSAGWTWADPYLYEFTGTATAGAVFFPVE